MIMFHVKIVRTGAKYGFPEERAPDVRADVSSLPLAPAYLPTVPMFFLLSLKGVRIRFFFEKPREIFTYHVYALGNSVA